MSGLLCSSGFFRSCRREFAGGSSSMTVRLLPEPSFCFPGLAKNAQSPPGLTGRALCIYSVFLLLNDGIALVCPAAGGVGRHTHTAAEADSVVTEQAEGSYGLAGGLAGVAVHDQLLVSRQG